MRPTILFLTASALIATAAVAPAPTPAERKIAAGKAAVAKNPSHPEAYANLALALTLRARETSDTSFYDEAQKAVDQALALDKTSYVALKSQAWILLGKHEFAKALTVAKDLNQRSADDITVYGFLSDANTELGNYIDAEKATQWMLDLRPGNIPGLTRAAHLRELFGDPEGAAQLMEMAYQQLSPGEIEDRAWVLTQLASLRLSQGKTEDAGQIATQALALFPDYHYALGALAKVRRAQKRFSDAVDLERRRYDAAPHAENLLVFAQTLKSAGYANEAKNALADFERRARLEMNGPDNANHELVFYYADHVRNPREALNVARLEFARRQDVHTLHAYAWALHLSGNSLEARKQIEKALAVGIQDADMYRHAGQIALKLKDRAGAQSRFQKSAQLTALPDAAPRPR